jgi:hypothetical protein
MNFHSNCHVDFKTKTKDEKKAAKKRWNRLVTVHPKLILKLSLKKEGVPFRCLFTVAVAMMEKPSLNRLLNIPLKFEFQRYSFLIRLCSFLKWKTIVIKSPSQTKHAEQKFLESPPSRLNLESFQPRDLLLATNPLSYGFFPSLMKPYFSAITKTYNLRHMFTYYSNEFPSSCTSILPNKKVVLTTLSMGKDSLWALKKILSERSLEKIVVVFCELANYGSSYREKEKFIAFKSYFLREKIDDRVIFETVLYEKDLIGIQSKENNILVAGERLKEPLSKMQYIHLLTKPLILQHNVGILRVPIDDEKDYDPNAHFGDQRVSFTSFLKFFNAYVGCQLSIQFDGYHTLRGKKIKELIECDWFQFNSSCYCNWNFFEFLKRWNKMNDDLFMCGQCFKCQEDISVIVNDPFLCKIIKLRR